MCFWDERGGDGWRSAGWSRGGKYVRGLGQAEVVRWWGGWVQDLGGGYWESTWLCTWGLRRRVWQGGQRQQLILFSGANSAVLLEKYGVL
jgi:hypothetical protein